MVQLGVDGYGLTMIPFLTCLYIAAAVLPIIGFGRLLWRIQVRVRRFDRMIEERGYSHTSYDDVQSFFTGDVRKHVWSERRDLFWDTALIGTGLVAGAVASIWSLYLP